MIQKSELQIVPVEQRVPGRVYGVADTLDGGLLHVDIHKNKNEGYWANWKYWFALPEPMLPVREVMPDEFELKQGEWDVKTIDGNFSPLYCDFEFRRIKPTLPQLTIPSGSKSEQISELEKILAELKQL
jgi:hypothetical protein